MRTLALLLLCLLTTALPAQTSPAIRSLQNKRAELQKQIAQKEKLLGTTQKDVRTQLQTLATLSSQIEERKKYIQGIQADPANAVNEAWGASVGQDGTLTPAQQEQGGE